MHRSFCFSLRSCRLFVLLGAMFQFSDLAAQPETGTSDKKDTYTLACYYFPNYHLDKRNQKFHGDGWTEWEVLKAAKPRFDGHDQPKVPLWGYEDEADPGVMNKKLKVAAEHGVDVFIFDWYYYDDGPFLQRALEHGYLKAPDNSRVKFAIMWANHDWTNLFPKRYNQPDPVLYPGKVTPETWDRMTDYIIEKYFKHPSYWLVDGAPYFSIYELDKFLESMGSVPATAAAIESFRAKTKDAGFKDLNLNIVKPGSPETVKALGFDSFTSYVWIHHIPLASFPETNYDTAQAAYFKYAEDAATKFSVPYYPNVTMGWDSSPRCDPDIEFKERGYPCTPLFSGNTPEAFKSALVQAKQYLDRHSAAGNILTINSWNEWTEGSYLEPDTDSKMDYLDAVKEVFGSGKK